MKLPAVQDALSRVPLHQRVVLELTRRIVQGKIAPGSLLPSEPKLAESLGVSRLVVREALRVLAEKGLIEVQHGRGSRVTDPKQWDPLDPLVLTLQASQDGFYLLQSELLEARRIFEVEIAGLAASRISSSALGGLSAHLRRMDRLMGDPKKFYQVDVAFHYLLVQAAENRVLARLLEPLTQVMASGFRLTIRLPGAPERAQAGHWAIFRAIEARDPAAAREAMRHHLEEAEEDLLALGNWLKDPEASLVETDPLDDSPKVTEIR